MKNAFTLAEVLITMGIVGVVSALTVPALNQSWQKDSYTTQLRKVYSEVAQAAVRCKTDNNVQTLKEARLSGNIKNKFIDKYFVATKSCGAAKTPCFADNYKVISGGDNVASSTFHSCDSSDVLTSGAALCTWWDGTAKEIRMIVDVNGPKDPNIIGRDLFAMKVDSNSGLVSDISDAASSETETDPTASGFLKSIIDAGWKMTY